MASIQKKYGWRAGFTLLEFLIVMGIVTTISIIVVILINPVELQRQSRDARRLSELAALNKALALYKLQNGYFGDPNKVYVSIPDPSVSPGTRGICDASLGFPSLPAGWNYYCVAQDDLRKTNGLGWMPVDFTSMSSGAPFSALPIDPTNTASNNNWYGYVACGTNAVITAQTLESLKYAPLTARDGGTSASSYEIGAGICNPPIVFPNNWTYVPGDPAFGTNPGFWVMKYEAKCADSSNSPLTSPNSGYDTYDNSAASCTSPRYITAATNGFPIGNISHSSAVSYCQSLGSNTHLLTNDEYMTIAKNAVQIGSNWNGAIVEGGNNNSMKVFQATSDDTQGMYGGSAHRRTLTLSNGSVIWDFVGNTNEHVQRSTNNIGDDMTLINLPACNNPGVWKWCDHNSGAIEYIASWNGVNPAQVKPPNNAWTRTNAIGSVYTFGSGGTQTNRNIFIRGGDIFGQTGNFGGPFFLDLGAGGGSGGVGPYTGFRCARP